MLLEYRLLSIDFAQGRVKGCFEFLWWRFEWKVSPGQRSNIHFALAIKELILITIPKGKSVKQLSLGLYTDTIQTLIKALPGLYFNRTKLAILLFHLPGTVLMILNLLGR